VDGLLGLAPLSLVTARIHNQDDPSSWHVKQKDIKVTLGKKRVPRDWNQDKMLFKHLVKVKKRRRLQVTHTFRNIPSENFH
jgi:hypothetical protein